MKFLFWQDVGMIVFSAGRGISKKEATELLVVAIGLGVFCFGVLIGMII